MTCGLANDEEVMLVWKNGKREPAQVKSHQKFGWLQVWVHKGKYLARARPEWIERKRS